MVSEWVQEMYQHTSYTYRLSIITHMNGAGAVKFLNLREIIKFLQMF